MITVTFQGTKYEFDLKDALESLTGRESILCEDYLGGWEKFRDPNNQTRSVIILVYLAKRSAGETPTFEEIENIPGLLFGNALEVDDEEDGDLVGQSPPESTQPTTTAPKPSEPDAEPVPHMTRLSERVS